MANDPRRPDTAPPSHFGDTKDLSADSCMAGNVITTCMPPTATTTTSTTVSSTGDWTRDAKLLHQTSDPTSRMSRSSPPVADRGGTPDHQKPDHPRTQMSRMASLSSPVVNKATEPLKLLNSRDKDLKSNVQTSNGKCNVADEILVSPKKDAMVMRENAIYSHPDEKGIKQDTESSEASEETSLSKQRSHRRERRSVKGSDVQKSIMNDMKLQDDSKSDLQRSESDGNQNSAPECDLSLSGSPFKEGGLKLDLDDSPHKSPQKDKRTTEESSKGDDFNMELHRSSPPVKDVSNAQCFSLKDSSSEYLPKDTNCPKFKAKTKSDALDKRHDQSAPDYSVLSSPTSVMKHKSGVSCVPVSVWEDRREPSTSWYKTPNNSSSGKSLLDESSSKDETSDSQDGVPPEFCDRRLTQEDGQGRHLVFDSKDIRRPFREWRTSLSESYRDQELPDSRKGGVHDSGEKSDTKIKKDRRELPEKEDKGKSHEVQKSSFSGKTNSDYFTSSNGAAQEGCEEALRIRNSALLRDLEEVMSSRDDKARENAALVAQLDRQDQELKHAREALFALKQDRKRLKSEKLDLLTQMKQLYSTLEDKEAELRQFIRSYTQKVRESDDTIKQLQKEREELESEKWGILKRARDEAERAVLLCTQLGLKDQHIHELKEQLQEKQMSPGSEVRPRNGFGSPGSLSYRTSNGMDSRGTATPTPGSNSPEYAGIPTSPRKVPMSHLESPAHRPSMLSRSAEDIFNSAASAAERKKPSKEKKGTWGSISRVFSRTKKRKALHPQLFQGQRSSWSPNEAVYANAEEVYSQKSRVLEETRGVPMQHWKAATVLAWLHVSMDMPHYAAACADNIKSGKLLLELSDSELEEGLGINNPMHRRKLRLAIEEHRQPSLCRYPKMCLLSHAWVLDEFLPSIALSCYTPAFQEHLVDGRVLDTLTKRDLDKHFNISRKFHQTSLMHAVQLLRMLAFDRHVLEQRRMTSESVDLDPLVWSNSRLRRWAVAVELGEYAENLRNTGVHGALAVLEPSFTAETMATALGIPPSKNILRRHLTTEWNNLIQPARLSLESESVVTRRGEKRVGAGLSSGGSSVSLASQGVSNYARRTLDRYDRRRSSWRESLRSLTSRGKGGAPSSPPPERPQVLSLSPRHRRTLSAHSDVTETTLTVTPV